MVVIVTIYLLLNRGEERPTYRLWEPLEGIPEVSTTNTKKE